ncbi:hypothetical protein Pmani_011419 [Petrolisthes manimaculis]|uniref:Uncharacterized protein n=1 Tax=Petrolisthes manimaculis TaxID=1843537 RepID=A0AAE1UEG2_9EUCA|nr:hypothetical protein Pmani_014331 [Petrolisthes manimaculis]KAK4317496.1 hypothetical protein Pmani_011419 [Petrolisthes manimaculis]
MRTPVASPLSSNQLHTSTSTSTSTFSTTSITLSKHFTSIQGQLLPCEGRYTQVNSPVTPGHTNGKKRNRSTPIIPPSSITITEFVPTPGPSTSYHTSIQPSHPHQQHNLTSSTTKIPPHLFLVDEDSVSESDIISRDEVWLDNSTQSSSSSDQEDQENENHETDVNLSEEFSFRWSEGSDFVPDQHDFQPNSSGTTRD